MRRCLITGLSGGLIISLSLCPVQPSQSVLSRRYSGSCSCYTPSIGALLKQCLQRIVGLHVALDCLGECGFNHAVIPSLRMIA